MVSISSKQLCTARRSPTMGLPSRPGVWRGSAFVAFRRAQWHRMSKGISKEFPPPRVRLFRDDGLEQPEPARTNHRLAFWADAASIFGTIAMMAALSVICLSNNGSRFWFRLKAPYGSMTSTTRKPTSESGQVAKRKSREAERQDELG
jgi:hypothetical protein